jgi:hypothetical protein
VTDFKVCLHGSDYAHIGADDVNPRYLATDVEHALGGPLGHCCCH